MHSHDVRYVSVSGPPLSLGNPEFATPEREAAGESVAKEDPEEKQGEASRHQTLEYVRSCQTPQRPPGEDVPLTPGRVTLSCGISPKGAKGGGIVIANLDPRGENWGRGGRRANFKNRPKKIK